MTLNLGDGIVFPDEAVTESFAILAKRGAGKSNSAVVMAEEMFRAGLPWVAVDPKGDWHGIRSSKDGKSAGLPIPIFGGMHGDLPLEPGSGKLVAELIVTENLTCVLDVSGFDSKAAQVRFLTDLADHLYRLHGITPQPRHVFVEEAHNVIPQRVPADMARCVGAWNRLVSMGRSRGLGISLVSQRSATVNKDCLTQTETLIVLRTSSPQDRKVISDWTDYHDVSKELMDSLPSLPSGEAWVCSPQWLGTVTRGKFRQRSTFDSGATPTMKGLRQPNTIAALDLTAVRAAMAATIEQVEANDPKRLKRRITELERELAQALAANPEPEVIVKEVPFIPPVLREASESLSNSIGELSNLVGEYSTLVERVANAVVMDEGPWMAEVRAKKPAPVVHAQPVTQVRPPRERTEPSGDLSKIERAILSALVNYPQGRTQRQVCMLSGYKNSGHMKNALSSLRTKGFVDRGQPIHITPEGVDALGDFDPLPTGPALRDFWLNQLDKAPRTILEVLLPIWPGGLTNEDLASAAGYTFNGHVKNQLSKLRTLELIERGQPVRVHPDFMEAIS